MECAIRSGKGRIEYNPQLADAMPTKQLELALRAELIRIFLKHPYERQPYDCCGAACALGSDCVLTDNYDLSELEMVKASDFKLPKKQYFEWYAHEIQKMFQGSSQSNDNSDSSEQGNNNSNTQRSELWEEDSLRAAEINDLIENIRDWGSIPGDVVEKIIASTKSRIDYRKALAGFRASILSTRRRLTRMRPNRRTEFENMGSIYRFRTRLLIAVDVSGSVSTSQLRNFYSVIGRFFKYGIESIDVIQFDCAIHGPEKFTKAQKEITITGRGGTSFQPAIDFAAKAQPAYDGVIFFTDGYADPPVIPPLWKTRLLYVLTDSETYQEHHEWMQKQGKVTYIQ